MSGSQKKWEKCSLLSPLFPLNHYLDFTSLVTMSTTAPPPWNHSIRSIAIDKMTFTISFDDHFHGSRVKITEHNKHSSHSLSLTWKSLNGLASSFNTLAKEPCSYKFFLEHWGEDYTHLLEKLNNESGYFVEIDQLQNSGCCHCLLVLSEINKQNWFSFYFLIFNYSAEAHYRISPSWNILYKEILQKKISPDTIERVHN